MIVRTLHLDKSGMAIPTYLRKDRSDSASRVKTLHSDLQPSNGKRVRSANN